MTGDLAALESAIGARRTGSTLRQAAAAAGVHVATLCRWQKADPKLRQSLQRSPQGPALWLPLPPEPGPVRWHSQCPLCRARVVVRTARSGARFWRCGRWPHCGWASWRPRAPRNCRRCGSPRYWSHSRKSIGCDRCGVRTPAP